jgi:hypothetical protein
MVTVSTENVNVTPDSLLKTVVLKPVLMDVREKGNA